MCATMKCDNCYEILAISTELWGNKQYIYILEQLGYYLGLLPTTIKYKKISSYIYCMSIMKSAVHMVVIVVDHNV